MLLDLTQSPSEMMAKMKDHTRYKIRRATERDELSYEYSDGSNPEAIKQFADYYDHYAALKGLGKLSRPRLAILAEQGALDLSFMRDKAGEILVESSCFVTPSRVRGLHLAVGFRGTSDPSRRSLIGRANRYLRWRDILRFREAGVKIFDFGGWYAGTTDEERIRVNGFKAEFAGIVVQEFSCERAVTLKGRVVSAAFRLRTHFSKIPLETPNASLKAEGGCEN